MQASSWNGTNETATPVTPLGAIERFIEFLPRVIIPLLTLFFLAFALFYAGYAAVEFVRPLFDEGKSFIDGLIKGLHTGVVALAVYELAQIIHQEHDLASRPHRIIVRVRRGVARFGGVVFVALVLESLIMVIKYSQQDLVGFLYYPAALIVSAALLLLALGVFIRLTAAAGTDHGHVQRLSPPPR